MIHKRGEGEPMTRTLKKPHKPEHYAYEFNLGQRVRPNGHALRRHLRWRVDGKMTNDVIGIVRGFGKTPLSITVQIVGQLSKSSYYVGFWEPVR